MGSQNPVSYDRTRTNWTPVMERYFIDLMLDQMHRGNRLGHTFNKQAWTDMLVMFNAKFGCKYDRDTLKIHYTNFWNQYNDLKNLLEQNGFSWDDTRKMVIADANVWDAYIKTQPDAEVYRSKTLANFNDLCLIYAYTRADGRYSRSSHDLDFDDDIQGMTNGVGIGRTLQVVFEDSETEWTAAMDQYFVKLMLVEIKKGNKGNNAFSKQAWSDMLTLFNAKFHFLYGRSHLRNRYKTLKKYFVDIWSLLKQKGFSWDEKGHTIIADSVVWDNYLKVHPDSLSYRNKTLLNYQDLYTIYGNTSNHGSRGLACYEDNFSDIFLQKKTSELFTKKTSHISVNVEFSCTVDFNINNLESEEGSDNHSVRGQTMKTCWTSLMDHYLTDLLLDQALRGNKIGYTFTNEAWAEMSEVFNKRFGINYGTNALKHRYQYLRTQYSDIKILLEQTGFYWDDAQETVTAEDHIWDSYTKEHPEAHLYKSKSVPSYHKLCLIYGQESFEPRCSSSAYNIDCGNEGPDLMNGEETQAYAKGNNLREFQMPIMDRYLIDLMLEHVHKGNRIGYSFSEEAWVDMAFMCVERFGLSHDKELLRIRHKYLGKVYNDMNNILNHRGFYWDEKRQMVTGYDDVWDAIVKENPDARSYKGKCTPNYNDLSLIYGDLSSAYIPCNDNGNKLNNGYLPTDWTASMDRSFIDLMLEQVRQKHIGDSTFSNLAWEDMVAKFGMQFGTQHDKDILKSRYLTLRKVFKDIKMLLDQRGFAWDESRRMVTATKRLWNAYIKDHHDAEFYYNRTLPSYNDLILIYGSARFNTTQTDSSHQMESENSTLMGSNGEEDDQSPDSRGTLNIYENLCMVLDNESSFRRSSTLGFEMEFNNTSPHTGFNDIVRHLQFPTPESETSNSRKKQKASTSSISVESIVDALQGIPGMDDELFLDACKLLEDERLINLFVSMDMNHRRKWLLKKLRG